MSTPYSGIVAQIRNIGPHPAGGIPGQNDADQTIDPTQVIHNTTRDYEFQAAMLAAMGRNGDNYRAIYSMPECNTDTVPLHQWDDLGRGPRPLLDIYRIENPTKLWFYASSTIMELHSRVTPQVIGKLFNLAFNLCGPDGSYIFNDIHVNLIDPDEQIPITELNNAAPINNQISTLNIVNPGLDPDSQAAVANSCCFFAATLFRLFSRSAESYSRAGPDIKKAHKQLYLINLCMDNFIPPLNVLEYVKSVFNNNSIMLNTLYAMLYAGETNPSHDQVKSFLYRNHLKHTGLHCFSLFMRVAEVYKIANDYLANVLNTRHFERELLGIQDMMNNCLVPGPRGPQVMWKYGRLFDQNFFSDLQTKKCPQFVATLAYMIILEAPQEKNQTILNIVHIRDLPEESKRLYKRVAETARVYIASNRIDGIFTGVPFFM